MGRRHYYKAINWDVRYPEHWDSLKYRTHRATKGVCVVCQKRRSTVIHHSRYMHNKDTPGVNLFPVCDRCHTLCHTPQTWIKDKGNPLWKNRNTPKWESKLKTWFNNLDQSSTTLI